MSDDLDELKKKKLEEMQDSGGEVDAQESQEQQMRQKLKQQAAQLLTEEARSRLGNIRAVKPDLASTIELQLVQLDKAGQIPGKIDDEQLKRLLQKIQESEDEPDIKYSTPR